MEQIYTDWLNMINNDYSHLSVQLLCTKITDEDFCPNEIYDYLTNKLVIEDDDDDIYFTMAVQIHSDLMLIDDVNLVVEESFEEKKDLTIVIADGLNASEYIDYLNNYFNVKVVDAYPRKNKVDLVLFTGGEDVNPELYGEEKGMYTSFNVNRDEIESKSFSAYQDVPKLGICRGSQFLTVKAGGKLIQHVTGHGRSHNIIYGGRAFKMTSTHHQMLFPFNLKNKNYKLLAHSEYFESHTYLNGDNKEYELPNDFLEPEIVYYPNINALCIQGHPEYYNCDMQTKNLCISLIKKYLLKNNNK